MNNNIYAGICPACKGDCVYYSLGKNRGGDTIIYECTCSDCKTEFEEVYRLEYVKSEITGKAMPEDTSVIEFLKDYDTVKAILDLKEGTNE